MGSTDGQYLDTLQRSTGNFDTTFDAIKADAVDRFKKGDPEMAKAKFREDLINALSAANMKQLENSSTQIDGLTRTIRQDKLENFEADIEAVRFFINSRPS